MRLFAASARWHPHSARMAWPYAITGLGVSGSQVRQWAVEARCDPRTIVVELRYQALGKGRPVRGAVGDRVRAVLAAHGLPATRAVAVAEVEVEP